MSLLKAFSYLAAGILPLCLFLAGRLMVKNDPQEPKEVRALIPIPFLGHLLGLYWYRTGYYTMLSNRAKSPIISLRLPGCKLYVVSSPSLMHVLHRHPKTVSFWFIEAHFTSKLGDMSQSATKDLVVNLEPDSREENTVFVEGLKLIRHAMTPQGGMDYMNQVAAKVTKNQLDQLGSQAGAGLIDLWAWVQHEVTLATTECVYGPANPYRDPKVERGFWDFADDTINILMTSILPKSYASKGIRGRETVVKALKQYFSSKSYVNGSSLIKARYASVEHNDNDGDMARSETVNGIAILGNSVPTAFWTIFHIFSDPKLLEKVRDEVGQITSASADQHTRHISLEKLKDVAIIPSVLQEALRHQATGTGPRMVMEDIRIGEENHLLKKDSVVIIANKALHFDKTEWGEDVTQFRADRFCGKTPGHAFRGFGGGVNLCPGRGFAMLEVGALIAMLVMRYDLKPMGGDWKDPGQDMTNMSLQIAPPKSKVLVEVVVRPEARELVWDFEF